MKNKVVKTKKDDDSFNELFETLIMLILALVLVSFIESTENKMSILASPAAMAKPVPTPREPSAPGSIH